VELIIFVPVQKPPNDQFVTPAGLEGTDSFAVAMKSFKQGHGKREKREGRNGFGSSILEDVS